MTIEEKISRIQMKANISKEEARAALEQNNGDMLDTIIMLERQGRIDGSGQGVSTSPDENNDYIDVKAKIEEQSPESVCESLKKLFSAIINLIRVTDIVIKRKEKEIIAIPSIIFVILLILSWEITLPIMVISLFFDVRYEFRGTEFAEKTNNVLNQVGNVANNIKNEFTS